MGEHLRAWPAGAFYDDNPGREARSRVCRSGYGVDAVRTKARATMGAHTARCVTGTRRLRFGPMKKVLLLIVVAALATVAAKKVRAV
jgi:hypothetical protein